MRPVMPVGHAEKLRGSAARSICKMIRQEDRNLAAPGEVRRR